MKLRSLFVKIFLWFWLAMLLVSITLGVAITLTRPEVRFYQLMGRFRKQMQAIGIIDLYEQNGSKEARQASTQFPFNLNKQARIFDETEKEILGQPTDKGTLQAVKHSFATKKPVSGKNKHGKFKAQIVFSESGKQYVIVSYRKLHTNMPGRFKFLGRGNWKSLLIRLLLIVAITFALCYGLARYITNPIIRLQKAARELAQGKLDHRIEASMEGRQDELVDLAHDFDVMAERVQDLLKTQRRLLGDISHELRTPLTRLNVALELVRESSGDEAEALLDRSEREVHRLQELINRIVTLVRLEGSRDHFTCGNIDLSDLVASIVADTHMEAKSRDCNIELQCKQECEITGSRELLRRAIENILRNALRHTPKGTNIEVSCKRNKGLVAIEVRDHGNGVPEEQLELLFQPFYRCEAARERSMGGVGLGLAIVRRSMEFHEGSVKAENADGGGLRIILLLPINTSA